MRTCTARRRIGVLTATVGVLLLVTGAANAERSPVEPSPAIAASLALTGQVERLDGWGSAIGRDWTLQEVRALAATLPVPASTVRIHIADPGDAPRVPSGQATAWVTPNAATIWISPDALIETSRADLRALILHETVHVIQNRGGDGRATLSPLVDTLTPMARALLAGDRIRMVREASASCLQAGDRSGYRDAPCQLSEALLINDWLSSQLGSDHAAEWWPFLAHATGGRVLPTGVSTPLVPTPELLREMRAVAGE